MPDNPSFEGYSALRPGEIRLLLVKQSEPLLLEFETTRLDNAKPYLALSYTWGSRDTHGSVSVNGLPFKIRENLQEYFRTWTLYPDNRLWIDAICIQQDNDPEINAQLRLVDSIYRRAQILMCWLGKATPETGSAFKLIEKIAEHYKPVIVGRRRGQGAFQAISDQDNMLLRQDPQDPDSIRAWNGIKDILQREYFSRTWIIQETIYQNASKMLLCGPHCVVWNAIGILDNVLYAQAVSHRLDLPWKYTEMGAGVLFHLQERIQNQRNVTLLDLLSTSNSFDCRYKRDKIYAIRSLAQDVGTNDLDPYVQQSLPELYKQFVTFYVSRHAGDEAFDFLAFAANANAQAPSNHPSEDDMRYKLPSWTPDWRYRRARFPLPKENNYRAGLSRQANFWIEGDLFFVRGIILDKVSTMSSPSSDDMIRNIRLDAGWESFWQQLESPQTSLERIVVADTLRSDPPARGFQIDWHLARQAREQPQDNYNTAHNAAAPFTQTCIGRRLFETNQKYTGIGPATIGHGDLLCNFFGGQVLYILRPKRGDQYQFIGECYVYGLMDGESLEDRGTSMTTEKVFCLT